MRPENEKSFYEKEDSCQHELGFDLINSELGPMEVCRLCPFKQRPQENIADHG
jgi:hypothetical protein